MSSSQMNGTGGSWNLTNWVKGDVGLGSVSVSPGGSTSGSTVNSPAHIVKRGVNLLDEVVISCTLYIKADFDKTVVANFLPGKVLAAGQFWSLKFIFFKIFL